MDIGGFRSHSVQKHLLVWPLRQILNIDGIGIRRKSADQPGSYDLLIGIMGSYRRSDRLLVIRPPMSQLALQPCASGRQDCLGFSSNAASLPIGNRHKSLLAKTA